MNLHPYALKSSRAYVAALLEACAKLKTTPLRVLTETAEVPKVSSIDMLEFLVGWFHGVAEASGVKVERLWTELVAIEAQRNPEILATLAPPPRRKGVIRARVGSVRS